MNNAELADMCDDLKRLTVLTRSALLSGLGIKPEVVERQVAEVDALALRFQRRAEQLRGDQPTKRIKRGEVGP